MAFPQQPVDAVGVPLSSSYIPNDNFYAIQASARKKTDSIFNTYTAPVFEYRTQEDIRSGLVYGATTGKLATATNTNLIMGASLFNPAASGKTLLVLSAKVMQSGTQADVQLRLTTADPQFGTPTVLNIYNLSTGGAASALAGISPVPVTSAANSASASVTVTGNLVDNAMLANDGIVDFIAPGMGILLPAGVANGIAIYQTIAVAGGFYAMSFKWVEY